MSTQTLHDDHLEDGALLAWIDGELDDEGTRKATRHLAECESCAGRLDSLRFAARRAAVALAELDVPSPFDAVPPALAEAAASRQEGGRSPSRTHRVRPVAAAAGLVLAVAAGAWAIPGSPVRDLVSRSAGAIASWLGAAGPDDPGPPEVSIDPGGAGVRVTIEGPAGDVRILLSLGDGPRATVAARQGRFAVEPGAVRVTDAGGDMRIVLPRTADAVVEIDGVVVATVREGRLTRTPDPVPVEIIIGPEG